MEIIEHARIAAASLPGIEHRTLASGGQGLKHLSVWLQTLSPGAATPPHRHDCEEVVVVLAGRGHVEVSGIRRDFGPQTTLVIPPDVDHQIFAGTEEPLTTLAVFSNTPVGVILPDGTPFDLPWTS